MNMLKTRFLSKPLKMCEFSTWSSRINSRPTKRRTDLSTILHKNWQIWSLCKIRIFFLTCILLLKTLRDQISLSSLGRNPQSRLTASPRGGLQGHLVLKSLVNNRLQNCCMLCCSCRDSFRGGNIFQLKHNIDKTHIMYETFTENASWPSKKKVEKKS